MKKFAIANFLPYFFVFFPLFVFSQSQCSGSFTEYYLNSNNIRASFFPRGNKFTDGQRPGFLVPYPSRQRLSTIFASSPWIAGYDDAGNLKLASETYPGAGMNDFSVGPLNSIGVIVDSTCGKFDQAWTVYYEDIQRHMLDFYEDFKIDDTIPSIFGWPGRGNKYFKKYYGFELPFDNAGLAPFFDSNGNNIYDPENGDYPVVRFASHSQGYIPDQILWMVFNDLDTNEVTGHRPLRFEIQLTAFAFHCQDNEILNNTIFNTYKIIDRAVSVLDSTFFGMWTDYDLGCYADDAIGSDSTRSTEFVYNADGKDGDVGLDCSNGSDTYAEQPPVQSMTYLTHPIHSFITASNETDTPIEFYRQLNGEWPDGTPITPEGSGYNPGSGLSPVKFLFSGDPRDTTAWAGINIFPDGADQRAISSVYLGRMDPGAVREVTTAYMFHYDSSVSHLDQITGMYENIDSLFTLLSFQGLACTPFPYCEDNDCVWPGDFNHNGISDQFDLVDWGVMKDASGSQRNGLVSWRGHYAEDWTSSLPGGINFKHGDGNGDGMVNIDDLSDNIDHFLFTNDLYSPINLYPTGPEIILTGGPMDSIGRIRNFRIKSGTNIENVLGLAYDIEFDTSIFYINFLRPLWPVDSNFLMYLSTGYDQLSGVYLSTDFRYSCVQIDHSGILIPTNSVFQQTILNGFKLKPGLTLDDIPDSTIIRLRNLIAIDPDGNDLHIGSNTLVVYKQQLTGTSDLERDQISIYPNPAKDVLYVDVPHDVSGELINIQGQSVNHLKISSSSPIDVSGYSPGIYFLRLPALGKTLKVVIY